MFSIEYWWMERFGGKVRKVNGRKGIKRYSNRRGF